MKSLILTFLFPFGQKVYCQGSNPNLSLGPDQPEYDSQSTPSGMLFSAIVNIIPDTNNPNSTGAIGTCIITQTAGKRAHIVLELEGLLPNSVHGWHFHEKGIISPNCTAAGAHFNPYNTTHGDVEAELRHVGDVGNFNADSNGNVFVDFYDPLVSLYGKNSVASRSLVIHQNRDDQGRSKSPLSNTSGNSGSRISCGIVVLEKNMVSSSSILFIQVSSIVIVAINLFIL